jgi:hypothetical protein
MTTCPRCGRVADDEFVCADCGMSLALIRRARPQPAPGLIDALGFAEEEDAVAPPTQPDVRIWRLAAVVGIGCLVVATFAILLLRSGGSPTAHRGALPVSTTPATSSAVPRSSELQSSDLRSRATPTSSVARTPTRTKSSPTPSPTHSRRRATSSSAAPRTRTLAETRAVTVAKGALTGQCGPHCYQLVVSLSGFPGGTHRVACWAQRGGMFGNYTTSANTSAACAYKRPNDSVWAVVDGRYHSNTITW